MRHPSIGFRVGWLFAVMCGCGSSQQPSRPPTQAIRSEQLIGEWHLIRAGGELPTSMNIKSLRIEIIRDGTWTSEIEMQGQFAGISMKGGGKWSLADGTVSYTSGNNSGKSRLKFESGRLVLDPDFSVRKDGTAEVTGEYERDP